MTAVLAVVLVVVLLVFGGLSVGALALMLSSTGDD